MFAFGKNDDANNPTADIWYSQKKNPDDQYLKSKYFSSTRDWMKNIPDDTSFSSLNIPGTHDTMAIYPYFKMTLNVCQKWKLIDQLNSGIRFIDIRVMEDSKGQLPIYHSYQFMNAYLEKDVIRVCESFLDENPTEVIVIMIRIEIVDDNSPPSLEAGFNKIIENNPKHKFTFENYIPNIGALRGKIWVWPGINWKYPGFSLLQNIENNTLVRQDEYSMSVKNKMKEIKKTSQKAVTDQESREKGIKIFMNQLNAANWYMWPWRYAILINKYVFANSYFQGIVVIDFPGETLIKKIIESNFPHEYQISSFTLKDNQQTNSFKDSEEKKKK